MVKDFAENKAVRFADVNLQGGGPRGSGSPGKGGWPTIRYYNKQTGAAGKDYEKKTSMAMCSELGPEGGLLPSFIEEAGKTSLCSTEGPEYSGCSDKQKKFIGQVEEMSPEDREKQIARLRTMKDKKMKPELSKWVSQRLVILEALSSSSSKEEL
mmetsp:Transcript_32118/g.43991  ORF Transcript_32118/g.43991 Transcript_32118/m.43991 type:complete len:155 (+) Transcript_32118:212-676(+)